MKLIKFFKRDGSSFIANASSIRAWGIRQPDTQKPSLSGKLGVGAVLEIIGSVCTSLLTSPLLEPARRVRPISVPILVL